MRDFLEKKRKTDLIDILIYPAFSFLIQSLLFLQLKVIFLFIFSLQEGINFLLKHPKVNDRGIGMVGISKGSEIITYMSTVCPKVRCYCLKISISFMSSIQSILCRFPEIWVCFSNLIVIFSRLELLWELVALHICAWGSMFIMVRNFQPLSESEYCLSCSLCFYM